MFCQNNIIAYTNTESKEIGFLDLLAYLQQLTTDKQMPMSEKLQGFNLDTFKNMTTSQLKQKIADLKNIFELRNKELTEKRQKLIDLQIINDNELPHAEEQLSKINRILGNQNFINSIKLIQNRARTGALSEEDNIKYSFFKELENQAQFLKNMKIGSMQKFINKKIEEEKEAKATKKVMNGLVRQMKRDFEMNMEMNQSSRLELSQILSVMADSETRRIIAELDREYTSNMNNSKLNLKGKVAKSLSNFLNIKIVQAGIIMKDGNFRAKLFGNLNMEDVQNKINIINNELNEHSIIRGKLDAEERQRQANMLTQFVEKEDDPTRRAPGFEPMAGTSFALNNIKKKIQKESLKSQIEKSLKESYKTLLNKKIISNDEYKMIVKIIESESARITNRNANEVKATIKVHVSRIIIKKYLGTESPMENVTSLLEKIFGKQLNKITDFEILFKNIINYESNEPFAVLKKLLNNMIDLLIDLQGINSNNVVQKTDNLLYKKLTEATLVGEVKKSKSLLKTKKERKVVFDDLNVMNLITLLSYTESGNNFSSDLLEIIGQKVELLENKKDTEMWSWASRENLNKIITEIINDEQYNFRNIVNEMMEVDDEEVELSDAMVELRTLSKNMSVSSLRQMKQQYNIIYDMFLSMYRADIIPYNLNRMNSTKSFEDLKREYFIGLQTSLLVSLFNKLLAKSSSKRMKNFITKNMSMLGMYLNEKSKFLVMRVEQPEPTVTVVLEEEKEENRDELLNDFMAEEQVDFEEELEEDLEDVEEDLLDMDEEDMMDELFGSDIEDIDEVDYE